MLPKKLCDILLRGFRIDCNSFVERFEDLNRFTRHPPEALKDERLKNQPGIPAPTGNIPPRTLGPHVRLSRPQNFHSRI